MLQIYDMGLTAFLPLRRKACWGFFFALNVRRLWPGLNPRTWVLKASTLPLDHRSRSFWFIDISISFLKFLQLQHRADSLENDCAYQVFIGVFGDKTHKAFSILCVNCCINFNERWAQTCTKNTKKIQDTPLPFAPTVFHFTSWKVCTVVTSCIPRETANQSAINLSVCMFARIHRANKGSGMLMRCAVTSQAWFHSNYWSAVTVIRIPVG